MNAIGLLLLILFGLMIFVGRGQGVKAFIGLICNFFAIFILIVLINWQFNPYIVIGITI